jgi:uncharacterized protein (DUF58 family)
MGVRDYQWGDSPRRIHWTATASTGRLLVKRYQPSIARETLICLDLNQGDYGNRQLHTATELAIITSATIAHHITIREKLPVGLATQAYDPLSDEFAKFYLPPRSERAHLMGVLEVLARVQIAPMPPFVDLLRQSSLNLSWGTTLLVITGGLNEALIDNLIRLRRAGFAVALILVQPKHVSAEDQARAELLSVPIHYVWSESNLEAWQ